MSDQQRLFAVEREAPRLSSETASTLSQSSDGDAVDRLGALTSRLRGAKKHLERARLASEIRDIAEAVFASNIQDANDAGIAWREIGAKLAVPFQTIHYRYSTRKCE